MAKPESRETAIKKMAEALFKGAKLLSETCPKCGSPLMEIEGKKICYVCMEEEKPVETERPPLDEVEADLLRFIRDSTSMLKNMRDTREAIEVLRCILVAVAALKAVKSLKKLENVEESGN